MSSPGSFTQSTTAQRFADSISSRAGTPARAQVDTRLQAYRIAIGAIMMSLLWKASYYPLAFTLYRDFRLIDDFFPALFRSSGLLAGLLILPLALGLLAMFNSSQRFLQVQSATTMLCMAGLCSHQGSYNDVTFLTCFWASTWCTWLAFSLHQPVEQLMKKAARFAMLIVSMIFLGGAVGKFTPGYWSGEVLFQVYFVDRDFWFFNLLRSQFDDTMLRGIATAYSRFVVIAETACAFLWLLPTRLAGILALLTFCGIITLSNFNLFSVMLCLLGLCLIAIRYGEGVLCPRRV